MNRRALPPLLLTLLAGLVLLAACGVPLDSSPRTISRDPADTTEPADVPPTTNGSPTAQKVSLYFLRQDHLEEVRYGVTESPTLGSAMAYVLAGPQGGSSSKYRTAIPPGTELSGDAIVRNGTARIDLSGEINFISGETQKQAFAQLVFTALALPGVQKVRFLIEGKGVDAPTDDGNLTLVTADDYKSPLNPR